MERTDRYRVIEAQTGLDLRAWVRDQRSKGHPWRAMAADLRSRGAVISWETLRRWFPEHDG